MSAIIVEFLTELYRRLDGNWTDVQSYLLDMDMTPQDREDVQKIKNSLNICLLYIDKALESRK